MIIDKYSLIANKYDKYSYCISVLINILPKVQGVYFVVVIIIIIIYFSSFDY